MNNKILHILIISLLANAMVTACSYNNKEALNIKSRTTELVAKHPVNDSIARIHYVAGNIAIIGEEGRIDLEIEPVAEIKGITLTFFASNGLKISRKNVRHYKKIDNARELQDSIYYTPREAGDHTLSIYILLNTVNHGTVARILTVPVRSGI